MPTNGAPIRLDYLDELVVALWRREREVGGSTSRLLAELFRREGLVARQQKRVKDLFFEMLANEALIEHALEVAAPAALIDVLQGPVRLLIMRVLIGDLSPKVAAAKIEWMDWERIRSLRAEVAARPDVVERMALLGSIPPWLAERIATIAGAEAEACLAGLTGSAPVSLRVNTLRCTRDELAARLAKDRIETAPGQLASNCLHVTTPAQLFRTSAFRDGWFEMQDEASQLVAEVVAPPPGGLVVDVCAGAGGKSLALAAALGNRGSVIALDVHDRRLQDLRKRARRAGANNLRAILVPEDHWPQEVEAFVRKADRILVDAPCSGLGSLRRNPDMRRRVGQTELRRLQKLQAELLQRSAALLAPGARVIYATCTLLPEENEQIVAAARARCPELQPVSVVEILGAERGRPVASADGMSLQTWPHRHGTDGFFAAVLRRPIPPVVAGATCG